MTSHWNHPGREFRRTVAIGAAVLILVAGASACGGIGDRDQKQNANGGAAFSFDDRIGWLHGSCLAISKPDLARGTPVALVITAEPQRAQQALILEQSDSPATCQPLLEGRAAINANAGMAFYALDAPGIAATDMGFGIVTPTANPQIVNGLARIDLDQDGRAEVFSSCATSEGINFGVWTDKAYEGEARWSGYYYLDYETTPTCP
jgi:hypothetical protein